MSKKFVVKRSCDFSIGKKAYEFDDYVMAREFLKWWWENDYNKINGVDDLASWCDDNEAKLYLDNDDEDYYRYELFEIENELPEAFVNRK